MPARKSLIGKTFARLTVIGEAESRRYACGSLRRRSLVLCECGKTFDVDNTQLVLGKSGSCGCLHKELVSAQQKKHGHTIGGPSPTYATWNTMTDRCTNPSNKQWSDYGGRGISVCSRWRSFECFLFDMGVKPAGTTIERINNNGNYCPENCRWATRTEQCRNKRNNHVVTFRGVTGCLVKMCELFSVSYALVRQRINSYGWSIEDAFTRPKRGTKLNEQIRPPMD